MKTNWKLFFLIEALLGLWMLFQIFNNRFILVVVVISALFILHGKRSKKRNKKEYSIFFGIFLFFFALLSTSAMWVIMATLIIFLASTGGTQLSTLKPYNFKHAPWQKKEIMVVETTESSPKNIKRFKRVWLGNERIGNSIYEWDDINFSIFAGDTIVDLGNTLLPKDESYVVIRKGFGKTRILIPAGIGVMIEHSVVVGKVLFEDESYELKNESVKMYSKQYDENTRKLKLITNVLIGDLEVISI